MAPARDVDGHGPAPSGQRLPGRDTLLLGLVSLAYGLAQIGSWRLDLGWDETIYVSQVDPDTPAAFFSAPRARGITLLAAPVSQFSSNVELLRIWFTLLSALALFLAFRLWFRVIPPLAAVLAALVFGSLWVAIYYGPQVMPNLWVAFCAVAAAGALLRVGDAGRDGARDRLALVVLPASLALLALMRPSDAAEVAAPIALGVLVVKAWRTRPILLAVYGGLALGTLPWVIEACLRFGGPIARLRQAGQVQGGAGFNPWLLKRSLQTLNGPLLCRPCDPHALSPAHTWWVFLLPFAVGAGLLVAQHAGRLASALLPTLCAASIGLPYLVLLEYTAPRFLLPSFALAALPTGIALQHLLLAAGRWRWPAAGLVVVLLAVHVSTQIEVLRHRQLVGARNGNGYAEIADALRAAGVRAPGCVISGYKAAPIAFYARCDSRMVGGHDGSISAAGLYRLSQQRPTAIITRPEEPPPDFARSWPSRRLPRAGRTPLRAWIAPSR